MSKYILSLMLLSVVVFSACKKEQNGTSADNNAVTAAADKAQINDHQDQVLTPAGWVAKSKVHHIETGEYLSGEGNRLRRYDRNGKVLADYGAIEQDDARIPFNPKKSKKPGNGVFPLGSGWITYTYWTNNTASAISYFATSWTVPPAPAVNSGQTIFLFNGLQNSSNILQPVLQWGPSAAGGGSYWAIANWYVGNNSVYSNLIRVNPGTNLQGIMSLIGGSGSTRSYTSVFTGYPSINLTVNNIPTLYWAAESLEAYGVVTCSNYPNTAKTRLSGIDLRVGGAQAPLSWSIDNPVTDCGQHSTVVTQGTPNGIVDIYY
ncbi:hypothetical protein HGH92_32035 [Chitinophaga varians]|uniref:Uncharacterized protein n=1 Tax=Chitinophaga varians TaxID=2202339 RepID=A0A847S6F5_9BACT|nr:hypothetical protein [Chitinophaga varians]NLR68975.1 hypothetical protein [Chitinophaga varians]